MTRILEILKEFLEEVEKENPFNLVLKGGTALSLYYLNHHRESEDLDFDTEKHFLKDCQELPTKVGSVFTHSYIYEYVVLEHARKSLVISTDLSQ